MTATEEARSSEEPPSYEASTSRESGNIQLASELPHFVLDGTLIFPSPPPSRAMYELNSPPCEAKSATYELRKISYRLNQRGEGGIRSRVDPIYTIRPFRVPLWFSGGRRHVLVDGLARGSTKEAHMVPSWDSPVGWNVKGLLKSEQQFLDMFRRKGAICWVDRGGRLIAEETRVARKGGKIERLPGLEVKVQLDERRMDLLVACWVARLWKEAEKDLG